MTLQIDHIVIFVLDLETAMRDFTTLGFNVINGGAHDNTENALIIFRDETYIELLALKRGWRRLLIRALGHVGILGRIANGKTDMYWRLFRWISGRPGIVDWCVRTKTIDTDLELWETHEFDVIAPQKFTRKRPDGKTAEWHLGGAKTFDLPFLLEDITHKDIRVPSTGFDEHSNGATGVSELVLYAQDSKKIIAQFTTLNIASPSSQSPDESKMNIGGAHIQIVKADESHKSICLKLTYSGSTTKQLDTKLCHNADIWMVPRA